MAYTAAFTVQTIQTSFRKAGIMPFNPEAVSSKHFQPARVRSAAATKPKPGPKEFQRVKQHLSSKLPEVQDPDVPCAGEC